ncbi:fructose-6-phosphate aldolase [Rickettsiales endosymbiont of Stachyamoeba lipophora]|uniref:fructose-6-phosphate aldolase n=1 Tax=Rickettsiales endosymbiont of Stachyamoeba lipophora TaxID=2486578 RepID=UPI000F64E70E|nr:fructose-6-phosphate aldolase [Rickettsiales endosymbiont of Stachyamoeba lipophora]AZL15044.1 fructose-6-phosphate aldolase [Rickettsiales endosymbiont of Stachyamoeba lipophora]
MKLFLDSANIKEIENLLSSGMVDGITTNPSLIAATGNNALDVINNICQLVKGPVSAEVIATNYEDMVKEGLVLSNIASNIVIKLPLTYDGLKACKYFSMRNIHVNVTLCFTVTQALLAAKAGATFISPFVGRLEDNNLNGMELIRQIKTMYNNYEFKTSILVASVRNVQHVTESAVIGADVATISPQLMRDLYYHPLTDKGLEKFLKDWQEAGQKII